MAYRRTNSLNINLSNLKDQKPVLHSILKQSKSIDAVETESCQKKVRHLPLGRYSTKNNKDSIIYPNKTQHNKTVRRFSFVSNRNQSIHKQTALTNNKPKSRTNQPVNFFPSMSSITNYNNEFKNESQISTINYEKNNDYMSVLKRFLHLSRSCGSMNNDTTNISLSSIQPVGRSKTIQVRQHENVRGDDSSSSSNDSSMNINASESTLETPNLSPLIPEKDENNIFQFSSGFKEMQIDDSSGSPQNSVISLTYVSEGYNQSRYPSFKTNLTQTTIWSSNERKLSKKYCHCRNSLKMINNCMDHKHNNYDKRVVSSPDIIKTYDSTNPTGLPGLSDYSSKSIISQSDHYIDRDLLNENYQSLKRKRLTKNESHHYEQILPTPNCLSNWRDRKLDSRSTSNNDNKNSGLSHISPLETQLSTVKFRYPNFKLEHDRDKIISSVFGETLSADSINSSKTPDTRLLQVEIDKKFMNLKSCSEEEGLSPFSVCRKRTYDQATIQTTDDRSAENYLLISTTVATCENKSIEKSENGDIEITEQKNTDNNLTKDMLKDQQNKAHFGIEKIDNQNTQEPGNMSKLESQICRKAVIRTNNIPKTDPIRRRVKPKSIEPKFDKRHSVGSEIGRIIVKPLEIFRQFTVDYRIFVGDK